MTEVTIKKKVGSDLDGDPWYAVAGYSRCCAVLLRDARCERRARARRVKTFTVVLQGPGHHEQWTGGLALQSTQHRPSVRHVLQELWSSKRCCGRRHNVMVDVALSVFVLLAGEEFNKM